MALTDTGDEVMGKIVAMEDKTQVTILTMDIGNLEGFDPSSSRGVNVMKTGAVIIALAMVVIGGMSTFMYSSEEGGMDAEVLNSIFSTGMELVKLLLGIQGAERERPSGLSLCRVLGEFQHEVSGVSQFAERVGNAITPTNHNRFHETHSPSVRSKPLNRFIVQRTNGRCNLSLDGRIVFSVTDGPRLETLVDFQYVIERLHCSIN
ncbi:hypothetical protein D3C86_1644880 [compost metagenome]